MNWEKRFIRFVGSKTSVFLHTVFFAFMATLPFFGVDLDKVLLVLTTIVSLEAIYLAIFIQMSVNQNTASLEEVEEDLESIQEDVEEIQEDVEEIQGDVEEIQEEELQVCDIESEDKLESIRCTLLSLIAEIDKIKSEKDEIK